MKTITNDSLLFGQTWLMFNEKNNKIRKFVIPKKLRIDIYRALCNVLCIFD